ncbi:uncharacterized protein Dyak_GE27928 [Drosophila yakuba]|uniref:Uncharacterized protein n=1 Tax=Drosophila yakuba TaxID=7245 RepID=A0A0R1E5P4_DROYA|nr:uncharacterized protein Dyak_GE27928 [Drosophila yakuba]
MSFDPYADPCALFERKLEIEIWHSGKAAGCLLRESCSGFPPLSVLQSSVSSSKLEF